MLPASISVYPVSICSFLRYAGLSNTNLFGPEAVLIFRDCLIIVSKGDLVLNGALGAKLVYAVKLLMNVRKSIHFWKEIWDKSSLIAGAISRMSC